MDTTDFLVDGFQNGANGKGGTLLLTCVERGLQLAFDCSSFERVHHFLRLLGMPEHFKPQSFADLGKFESALVEGVTTDQVGEAVVAAGVLPF